MATSGRSESVTAVEWDAERAGRRWDRDPRWAEQHGQDNCDELQREAALRRRLVGSPPVGPAPADTLKALLRDDLGPELRRRGLKGSGGRYRLDRGDCRAWIEIQRSTGKDPSWCEFTFNLGATNQATAQGFWHDRIGNVLPPNIGSGDTWWVVPQGSSIDGLRDDLLAALGDHAVMAMEAALDEPQDLAVADRVWGRVFEDPRRRWPEDVTRRMMEPNPEPWWRRGRGRPGRPLDPTYEDLLAEAEQVDFDDRGWSYRSAVFHLLLDAVPAEDIRWIGPVAAVLANEPMDLDRAEAAGALAVLGAPPELARPHLVAANEQDSDPRVRVYARYAHRLLDDAASAGRSDPLAGGG